jgi:hypothetical protein
MDPSLVRTRASSYRSVTRPPPDDANGAVTVRVHGLAMLARPERCEERRGVCVVRVVRQSTGVLITLTERVDVDEASTQIERTLVSLPETVDAVRDFLVRFLTDDDCPEVH